MNLPVIDTPVFPRWVWIEEIAYSHIFIATIITAFMLLAPVFETIGVWKKDKRYDRLAQALIWFAMILFSPGAALGTGIPVFIIGTYPEFWSRWSNLFFWPLVFQFIFFLLEVGFLFFGYYLIWQRWYTGFKKKLHIAMGFIAAFWGFMVQVVWDSLGSYMLTPGEVALPGVNEPVGWSWAAFANPSFPYLLIHRVIGNFSYTMLLVGGVYALLRLRKKITDEDRLYYAWSSDYCFGLGYAFFFGMPLVGWLYAKLILRESPMAFYAIMGGNNAFHFIVKMALILIFLTLGGLYLAARHKRGRLHVLMSIGVLGLAGIVLAHPPLHWLGDNPVLWRATAIGVLALIVALLWLARRSDPEKRHWRWAMFVAGLAAAFAFAFGGFVRESARQPDTVYGMNVKPEVEPFELGWKALYTGCVGCHAAKPGQDSPLYFDRYAARPDRRSWPDVVQAHRASPDKYARNGLKVDLDDEQARRILDYLQENFK